MLTSVRQRANVENQTGFLTDPEIRGYINEAAADLWDMLIEARGQEHMRKTQTLSTTAGVSAYSLASDFDELISVDIQIAPLQRLDCLNYQEYERNMFQNYPTWPGWYLGFPVFYRILGSTQNSGSTVVEKQINFIPYPQSSAFPVLINYYPVFTPFATDGSQDAFVFNGVNGWESYIIWRVVAICRSKLKEDASFALTEVARVQARIKALAGQNDAGGAERIKEVSKEYGDPFSFSR